ncbi:MAG: Bax inhibitor-1/YccA family protein [Chitinophagaceae bacterium]|nr:Bax inhibitor-1/YccA family protein [Chitinophagaceae bacterium]
MELFKSGNPTLTEKMFQSSLTGERADVMTVKGTLNKFGFMLLMVMASAFFSWYSFGKGVDVTPYMWTGAIGGLVVAFVIIFKKTWAPYLAPAYALLEGLFVGAISAYYNFAFAEKAPFIIVQAVGLTFGVALAMFVLYNMRIIRATETFKSVIITATAGIAIFYLITIVLRFFSIDIPFIHQGSTFGIIFSLIVVGIAALNLILDFDMIEKGSDAGAPKFMEWYGAFGLLVTIVWLYLEILRLLAKLNSRK